MIKQVARREFLFGVGAATGACLIPSIGPAAVRGTLPRMPDAAGLPLADPQTVGMAPDLSGRIATFMQSQIDRGILTGGVTAVARNGKVVDFAAHGLLDIDKRTPMRTDGIFRMMSSGKQITAVALLQQLETGRVALDDKISRFIPELRDLRVRRAGSASTAGKAVETDPANREITVGDLATHTSGLDGVLLDVPPTVPFTLAARVPYAKMIPLDFQPGTLWAYSSVTGPDILARIVEMTSGMAFDTYLRERVFEPIGMRDTGYNLTSGQRLRVVPRYTRADGTWRRAPDDTELADRLMPRTHDANPTTTYFSGSFGLFSTTRDYLLFEMMLLDEGAIRGRRVLRPESVALMRSNLVGNLYDGGIAYPNSKGTGFGILVRTVVDAEACDCARPVGAFGWAGAYGTASWADPANQLVAVYLVQQRVLPVEVEFGRVIYGAMR